jgi:hypothetical protein
MHSFLSEKKRLQAHTMEGGGKVRWKGTHHSVLFEVEVGLTTTDSLVMSGAFSPVQTTGSLVNLHEKTTSEKIESNQG